MRVQSNKLWPFYALVGLQIVTFVILLIVVIPHQNNITSELQAAQRANCERGNITRPQQISAYLDIAQGNRDRAAAWVGIGKAFPTTQPFTKQEHDANIAEANRLERDAQVIADAQRKVSAYPDAKSLVKRSIVDCDIAAG